MRIGRAADRAGVTPRALRYYEEEGLIRPARTAGGHREYSERQIAQVALIRRLREAGVTASTVRELLPSVDTGLMTADMMRRLDDEQNRISTLIESLIAAHQRLAKEITHSRGCLAPEVHGR